MPDQDQATNESVSEEVTHPGAEASEGQSEATQAQNEAAAVKKSADYNWSEMRRAMAEKP
jgi:hypothetical protein